MSQSGRLVTWKPDKGFGFIRPAAGGRDVFVHRRDFGNLRREPREGDLLHFQPVKDKTGRPRAADVRVEGLERAPLRTPPPPRRGHARASGMPVVVALAFGVALLLLFVLTPLPLIVPALYAVASLAAYLLYAFDKAAAMNRRRRTTENTLLMAGLLGGWPGALVAQSQFRHKTRKASFQVPFWLSVAINCAALSWACTHDGAERIRAVLY